MKACLIALLMLTAGCSGLYEPALGPGEPVDDAQGPQFRMSQALVDRGLSDRLDSVELVPVDASADAPVHARVLASGHADFEAMPPSGVYDVVIELERSDSGDEARGERQPFVAPTQLMMAQDSGGENRDETNDGDPVPAPADPMPTTTSDSSESTDARAGKSEDGDPVPAPAIPLPNARFDDSEDDTEHSSPYVMTDSNSTLLVFPNVDLSGQTPTLVFDVNRDN